MSRKLNDVDKTAAFLLEFIPGFFGLMGIGYIYAGDIVGGILRLILWPLFLGIAWTIIAFLMVLLIGLCFVPVMIVIQFLVPIWSAVSLKRKLEAEYPR
jgi:TM2 domain-containing membrane protein YozV